MKQEQNIASVIWNPGLTNADGTVGAHTLDLKIPDNAIVRNVWYDVITTCSDSDDDSATIALHFQTANDCVSAIAISDASNVWDAGVHNTLVGSPVLGADAAHDTAIEVAALQAASYIKTTAIRTLTVTVADDAVDTGKVRFFVEYIISE